MSVDDKRSRVLPLLENSQFAAMVTDHWTDARQLLHEWWDAYKAWERGETFKRAFEEERMAIRWCSKGLDYTFPKMQATRVDALPDEKGNYATSNYQKGDGAFFKSNVGMKGILARLDPAVFVPSEGGASKKTELGLHDLSASLLKKSKPITAQLHNSGSFANKTPEQIRDELAKMKKDPNAQPYYVFMPISKPADQKLFHLLNDLAKQMRVGAPEFYKLIREYRSKMTRLKLACEHDMGAGFLAYAPDSTVNPKFKYGHQMTTKLRISGMILPGRRNDANVIKQRKANAMAYDQMLQRAKGVNEVTIAYRHHESQNGAGERFPMLAELVVTEAGKVGFQGFSLKEDGKPDISSGRFIPNEPLKG